MAKTWSPWYCVHVNAYTHFNPLPQISIHSLRKRETMIPSVTGFIKRKSINILLCYFRNHFE
nr:MAG TPA: hypothetical protein [Caudoviricetes sp.]